MNKHNIPSVGNRVIDANHEKMFDIICHAQHSIMAKECTAIMADFNLLEDFACACFSVEEEIARAVGVDFTLHNLSHQNLLNKCLQLRDKLAASNGSWSDSEGKAYAKSLIDCWMKHLDHESRPLMYVLDTYFYDFKPT